MYIDTFENKFVFVYYLWEKQCKTYYIQYINTSHDKYGQCEWFVSYILIDATLISMQPIDDILELVCRATEYSLRLLFLVCWSCNNNTCTVCLLDE